MRIIFEHGEISRDNLDTLSIIIKAQAELHGIKAEITHLKEVREPEASGELHLYNALNLLCEQMLKLENDLREHCAIGNPMHKEVI